SDGARTNQFFSLDALSRAKDFILKLIGIGAEGSPAFADLSMWAETAVLASQTLAMSILGIAIAALIALVTFMFGARNVMGGEISPYSSPLWRCGFLVTRTLFIITRGIPELVWAMLVIFVFSPGILAGAIGLGIHNAGILGKLSSEVVEGLDPRPIRALRSTGSGRLQVLAYGVLPQALPRFITYLLYRWEVIIRTTIVVGFVAAGGLGMEFRLSMSLFHYTTVTLILIWYLVLVIGVDLAAAFLRRVAS
ncbi:ABC transporter permease subunit, partial [Dehalococcoidia bacterium]|nr:ABC transporter permease subunit [Dehalococcoidia bacterium]